MTKDILTGCFCAVMVFMIISDYDVIPLLILSALVIMLAYFIPNKKFVGSRSAQKNSAGSQPAISFNDIGGQSVSIRELKEALDFVKDHENTVNLGIRPLKGILLNGPPGTGKTLLAKAAAAYTKSAFIAVSGSEFIEMYAGVGAQRIRSLFQSARDTAKKSKRNSVIIFIDEIEILGTKRGKNNNHLEYDQTLNQLLVEMDGLCVNDNINILVIGATNRADMLDEAILRPGRFDRQVKVDLPDKQGRLEILQIYCQKKPLAEDVNLEEIARNTLGFSGAHLEAMVNEAAIYAWRYNLSKISHLCFKEAIDKVLMGEKIERLPDKKEMYRSAIHETGHAIISEINQPNSVAAITISPRGNALGYIRQSYQEDHYLYTKEYLEKQICTCLAGSAAEQLILGNKSTGAANDFEKVIGLAENIIRCGMSSLGIISFDNCPQETICKETQQIIEAQQNIVLQQLNKNKNAIKIIADKLLLEETLFGDDFRLLFTTAANYD